MAGFFKSLFGFGDQVPTSNSSPNLPAASSASQSAPSASDARPAARLAVPQASAVSRTSAGSAPSVRVPATTPVPVPAAARTPTPTTSTSPTTTTVAASKRPSGEAAPQGGEGKAAAASAVSKSPTKATAVQGPAANSNLVIEPGAVVCRTSNIEGDVTIMAGTVVHPKASIIAEAGPIIIGPNNIIEEFALIKNEWWIDDAAGPGKNLQPRPAMVIGSHNLFGCCCEVTSSKIGNYNKFEPRARVSADSIVGSFCLVGAAASAPNTLLDYTAVYGPAPSKSVPLVGYDHEEAHELHMSHLKLLVETLPHHNHVVPTTRS